MKFAALPALTCLLLTLTCVGCGKSVDLGAPVEVKGTATLDGQPLDKTTVGFTAISKGLPARYRYVSAITDASGNFTISQVYPAEYSVTLNQDAAAAPAAKDAAVAGNPKLAKYTVNSPLKANVSKDSTTFKFEATSGK